MSQDKPKHSNSYIIIFITIVCFVCALILSVFATLLKPLQEREEEIYQSKQLLITAKILNDDGQFIVKNSEGKYVSAIFDEKMTTLAPFENAPSAPSLQIFNLQKLRVVPFLTDEKGDMFTFEQKGIQYEKYLSDNQKYGFAHIPLKLVFKIYPNVPTAVLKNDAENITPIGYIIPINGYGLWDAIYGFLAIEANGETVIGTTWYDQKETPGLGANIATPEWQKQFHNKLIFQPNQKGEVNLKSSKLGITVVKTSVMDELGNSPLAINAVDGIAGATVTRNGVQEAYKSSLGPYRNFLIKIHEKSKEGAISEKK
ncbi:MAG: NADH:ubiquinone reductase (Na(+)-transporting) subunit C [Rhabdochlamydiaceae bacterium]|nr:NADH:ubiquinone reductase (Na(+)-transporting) subunit C [Candidatus Amphrikana amoebophyrae]